MQRDELAFPLPEELIARHPEARRDGARLLLHRCAEERTEHHVFRDLPELLQPGDLLVQNDTRVLPARLLLQKPSGGRVEALWLGDRAGPGMAELMVSGSRLRPGLLLGAPEAEPCLVLVEKLRPGRWLARALTGDWAELLTRWGSPPLPPYIRRLRVAAGEAEVEAADRERYQTVWAGPAGSVAAPTASLHFTPELLAALDARGIERCALTLHVGVGTFAPIEAEQVEQHRMHGEDFVLDASAAAAIRRAQADGRRIIAAGTTVARVLESLPHEPQACRGRTELFVLPGFRFRVLGGLLTNFHTPHSTLLALVAAWCQACGGTGLEQLKRVYAEAVAARYRFFSYGDASLWLR